MENYLKVAMAQIAPVWLDKRATLQKIEASILEAVMEKAELIIFGEAFLPGYPFWLAHTDGAAWNLKENKELHAHYVRNAIQIETGELDTICKLAKGHGIAIYLGMMERAKDRGGHSLYCSLVYINENGAIKSVHRKLQPTYDERLTWAPGDGNGLQVHPLKQFTVGGLNCWENWMPLPRAALHAQGEDLHVAGWPGSRRNTEDLTPVLAKEGRSFVVSVCGVMRRTDVRDDMPDADAVRAAVGEMSADGGSCICAPDGTFLLEPWVGETGVRTVEIDIARVREERQNFDPSGHYSRPDVTRLIVNRERQATVRFED